MTLIESYLKKPHLVMSLVLLAAVVGIVGYIQLPVNLFPDSERPKIAVVTVNPGASATEVETDLTRVIEKELSGIEEIRLVTSVSKDEVSAVTAEFRYSKSLDSAATDVASSLSKVRALLPSTIRSPMIFKVSSATPAVMTIAMRPKDDSPLDLSMIRQLADNPIKERLLQLSDVANVEVFGGHQPIIRVELDRDRLERHKLSALDVRAALAAFNANQPVGLVISSDEQFLLKRLGQFQTVEEAGRIPVARRGTGTVRLEDVATIRRGSAEPQSAYHGNGKPAIALNVQRALSGNALDTIDQVAEILPALESAYPGIEFFVPDNQGDLIGLSVGNMKGALRDAVIMTVIVIFLFLADLRGMILAAISIPFTYVLTFMVMWLVGFEFNMVTLTAVVIAVGMLVDDAIVVLENIDRHYKTLGEEMRPAVLGGTQEVALAILSGTYSLVLVLLPIMFVGGYVQTVLRPLTMTLSIALVASYIVSITVIPLLAPLILKHTRNGRSNWLERWVAKGDELVVEPLRRFYVRLTGVAVRHRLVFIVLGIVLFLASARQMPLVGRDLMPPMDAGILIINYETDPNSSLELTEKTLTRIEETVLAREEVRSISSVIGSEAAVISFGSGRLPQQGRLTVHLVDRFHRDLSIWEIEKQLRENLRGMPGMKSVDVYEFGATPLSSIRAPVDVMISGPDLHQLDLLGKEVEKRLRANLRDLSSISRSWTLDNTEVTFRADPEQLALYHLSPEALSRQLQGAVRGMPASTFRVPNQDGLALWIQLPPEQRAYAGDLHNFPIVTPLGEIPLAQLGALDRQLVPSVITRQGLQRTLDIQAYRGTRPISHLQEDVEEALVGLELPPGYSISHEGEIKQMNESFGRLGIALALGLILLYFSLVPAFDSFVHPLTIMSAIPLALIGAAWAMLIFGKHGCMPSMMGMILLAGVVVKNSILLIDFITEARKQGKSVEEALIGSVDIRTRPILMTAFSTVVGMIPIAGEWAIGLERLSPLAIVAIGGLTVSTFLTMVYVPVFYSLFDEAQTRLSAWFRGWSTRPAPVD